LKEGDGLGTEKAERIRESGRREDSGYRGFHIFVALFRSAVSKEMRDGVGCHRGQLDCKRYFALLFVVAECNLFLGMICSRE
jgi:hypothetical protein